MVPVAQDINFEEKLEEANSLIEKVRKALKDIGKGIYKVPEHKRAHGDADEPVRQCSENVRCVDMVCSFHGQCRTLVNQNGEAAKEQKTVAKEQIQESKAQAPQADTKSDVKIEVEEKQQIREEVAKEKQQIREEGVNESITPDVEQEAAEKHLAKPVNDEGKESPRDTSGDEFVVKKTEDKKFVTPSMEMLQEKLQAISEVSESDASTEKPVEQKRPVPRMERGSSPIDLTRGKVEAGDEVSDPNAGSPNRHSFVQTWTEGTVTQQPFLQMLHSDTTISESSRSVAELASGIKKNASGSEVNSSAPEGTQSPDAAKTYESGSSSRRGSNQRSSKLSIQMMPPVNIRGGLVMQRTLNLCIKPTGSVTNDLSVDQGNIGYEEITTDGAGEKWAEPEKSIFVKCPDDCKNPTTEYCKYKSAEYEDVDLNNGTNEIKDENTNEVLSRCSEETDGVVLIKPAMSNASREKPRSSHQETCSGRTPKITASGGLNEDALLLFRSFQILDDEKYQNRRESQFSLATLTQNIARSVLNTDPVNTPQKRLEQLARIENASETLRLAMSESSAVPTIYTAPSDSQRVKKIIHVGHRTPWEIGFYQTKSTQCSQTYLAPKETSVAKSNPVPVAQPNPVPVAKPKSAEALTRTSSADEMPKTSTAEASPVSGSASSSPRSSTASQPVTSPDRTPLSRSHYSDESTSRSSEPTPVTKNTDHVQSTDPVLPTNDEIREQPVKDITQHRSPHHHQISMADILSILKGALPVANTEDNAKSAHNSTSSSSNDSVTKGSVIHGTPTTMSKKSAKEFSSSSSTSSSSSNADVHKSVHSSSAETMTHTQNGVKRKHTSDSGVHDDSVKTVQSIRDEEKRSVPYVKTDSLEKENDVEVKEPKPKHKEPAVDVEHEVSKETKPADPKVQKVDANLQVSLDSSTGSASSSDTSFYSHRERLNTIAYFIKGLTGTSQDELDKLRSNPSFPKTDLPNWSKTVLKTLQEQNALPRPSLMSDKTKEEMSKRSMYEVTRERVMDTTDYGDRSGGESKQRQPEDAESVLSDNTKMKRLREFQKFAQQAQGKASRDTKASKSKVVMTVAEEIGDVGEKSDDLVSYSKRNLPFYRRVLGRILEPSNRKPMQTSQSDANPVDESVSEGEIKCKSSASIGEVAPRKYPNERKKSGKGGVKYLKKHPEDLIRKELSDKSLRIARQRTQIIVTKSGKKVCVIAVVRINPGTLVVYNAVERIKGGHQTERASPSAVSPPGTRDAVSSPRSTWTHHPATIKATGPHHPAPTSTLAGDCSGPRHRP
ncbi:hypothetical protein MTP99_012668 [Tenebrio molitor]|nr:hypothetical protein MTP99_012668 [Tenebrio molitor]